MSRLLSIFFLILVFVPASWSQSREQLESKRKSLIKEIRSTSRLLQKTSKDRKATLNRYRTLEQQIKKRQELIETLQAELEYAIESLERTSNVVFSLEEDLTRLEKEYGALARSALRQRMNQSSLLFLFSATNFNQAVQRWQYLKQYNVYRKRQAALILQTKSQLADKMQQLELQKQEKQVFIEETEAQNNLLAEELNDKSSLLAALQKDEERLRKDLGKQQDAHAQLNSAIEKIIQSEIVASRKRERSRSSLDQSANPSSNNNIPRRPTKTPESTIASNNFSSSRGQLPWPVTNGVIIKRFGKQPHPTLKSIQITNNGIDIQTSANAKVRCVFPGKVVGKQFVPGYDNMLIIKHGDYYTVYSNLKEVYVQKGDQLKSKQAIGVASQKGNVSQVHFEVWRGKERLNPASWISG